MGSLVWRGQTQLGEHCNDTFGGRYPVIFSGLKRRYSLASHTEPHVSGNHVAMDEVCELVRVLLEKSANPEKLIDLPDVKGRSLLSYAVEAGDRCAALSRLLIT